MLISSLLSSQSQDEDGGGKAGRAYPEPEVPPPLPKSPPPIDPVMQHQAPLVSHTAATTSRVAFRSHLTQGSSSGVGDEGRQQAYPASSLRPNGDTNGYMPSSSSSQKKNVSWNDTVPQPAANPVPLPVDEPLNGGTGASSGITLEDIDEVLGSSTEQDEPSALLPNTPNVIGSQEVYRDPRERMIQEKMRNKPQAMAQGPEKLSFKEKMQMFAIQQNAAAAAAGQKNSSQKSGQRDAENGNANAIPEEET